MVVVTAREKTKQEATFKNGASFHGKILTGAQIFVRSLLDEGVDTIFGYPGGVVLSIYDELYKTPELKHILVRHEQGGTHAADGYARATGKPGLPWSHLVPGQLMPSPVLQLHTWIVSR